MLLPSQISILCRPKLPSVAQSLRLIQSSGQPPTHQSPNQLSSSALLASSQSNMNKCPVLNAEAIPTFSKPHTPESRQPLAPSVQPTIQLSGPYSGAEELPSSRWLIKLQYNLKSYYQIWSPAYISEYISAIRFLLTGEAAEWAEDNPLMQAKIIR